jgi:hypothetical protein
MGLTRSAPFQEVDAPSGCAWGHLDFPVLHVLFVPLSTIPRLRVPGLHSGESHTCGLDWAGPRGPWDSVI